MKKLLIGCLFTSLFLIPNIASANTSGLNVIESKVCTMDYGITGICGTVRNTSGRTFSSVGVTINLYDSNGNVLNSTGAYVSNLRNNTDWKFQAPTFGDFQKYRIEEVTGF